jgi:hypothetical protein
MSGHAVTVLFAGLACLACLAPFAACSGSDAAVPADPTDAAPPPAPPASTTPPVDAAPPPPDSAPPPAPLDVPTSLVKALGEDGKTYVEGNCQSVTYPGWPNAAQKCTYQNGLVVTIANPTPERVAAWIVDASSLIPALDDLHTRDRANWEAGLIVIAAHTIGQSSRIFPLEGQVYENGTAYSFERGVTSTCSTGCYCRINSLSRPQWCAYATSVLKSETSADTCLSKYGQTQNMLVEPWLAHCLANHIASWSVDRNDDYRAQAWFANQTIATQFKDPTTAVAADVIAALKIAYPAD